MDKSASFEAAPTLRELVAAYGDEEGEDLWRWALARRDPAVAVSEAFCREARLRCLIARGDHAGVAWGLAMRESFFEKCAAYGAERPN